MIKTDSTKIFRVIKDYAIKKGALSLDADYLADDCRGLSYDNRKTIIGYERPSITFDGSLVKRFSISVKFSYPDINAYSTARLYYSRVGKNKYSGSWKAQFRNIKLATEEVIYHF